ncbi:restriction endonuclease [Halalkalibacter kiskunsagensis]|uniref:Restriction endonuclease n=1 Tax=Halalkalibacter kiskunsagensis TaxID=1548599 RepID=A0ABV6KG78_9BACI
MNLQQIITILAIIITLVAVINWFRLKHKHEDFTDALLDKVESDLELRKTLAMGLYMRFKKKDNKHEETYSSYFLKEDPVLFEHFVADLLETKYGGDMYVNKPSGNYGINFENRREDGLYLGQIHCHKEDIDFESIAIIHSNMKKWKAVGAYVITTAGFSDRAVTYADGLGIELINGIDLVNMWFESMKIESEYVKELNPSDI